MRKDRTMKHIRIGAVAFIGLLGLGAAACGGGDDPPVGDVHGEMPMGEPMEGMSGMQAGMADMQRHAEEADSVSSAMREHVRQMRALAPGQWHDRMGEHVTRVSGMLAMMNRHMGEMDMGMGMGDDEMGRMMGMTGEEHRRMMEDMQALRADLEQLQTASREQVRERMPDHFDRLERMVEMLGESAEHMGSM